MLHESQYLLFRVTRYQKDDPVDHLLSAATRAWPLRVTMGNSQSGRGKRDTSGNGETCDHSPLIEPSAARRCSVSLRLRFCTSVPLHPLITLMRSCFWIKEQGTPTLMFN